MPDNESQTDSPQTDSANTGPATSEPLAFQAEVSRLLDIVANALYSNRDIFLRELISNGADACDRLRYLALTQPELLSGAAELAVELRPNAAAKQLEIVDSGVGMTRDELIENLGTIAHSGSAKFLSQLGDKKTEVDLIGQFGVGFYSAFMVADKVEVFSRRAGEQHGWRWESDGRSGFTVEETTEAPARGTRILLHLKEDAGDYAEPLRLRHIVKTYSDHISVPVKLSPGEGEDGSEPETLNSAGALWARPKSEVTEEQYQQFYHDVAHAFDQPWQTLHFKAEGMIEYSGLLFIPGTRPLDLFDPSRRGGVKLYVKRVFITDDCTEVVPTWLRFLRGVVDSEDLPLNVSRELLQNNPVLAKIRQGLTKRVLSDLEKKAEKEPEAYVTFWENFGPVLKEGLYEDSGHDDTLLKLARFKSTAPDLGDAGWTTLADYLTRMPEEQEAIYILAGDDLEQLVRSPQLEGFRAKGIEVLLLTDPIDEFWTVRVGTYRDKPFRSVTRAGGELDKVGEAESAEDADEKEDGGLETLLAMLRVSLQGKVKDVRASKRLTDSPVCLVADEGDIDLHLARLLKQHQRLDDTPTRILELNPKHPLVAALSETAKTAAAGAGENIEEVGLLLLDQARILEGEPPLDPAAFSRRLAGLVAKGLN
ncbi:molecular chaperone HtpG [Algihabitans albus]|uniref:molecular chaperone HtpG n=1 Tax=Algihabitans albus TaxID=2164067 RepID=UPI000E5CBCA0|nr:molecular chaperone HtpG [Algihabitans albus]